MKNHIETETEIIIVSKKQTQRVVNRLVNETPGDKSFFVCMNDDDSRNNGYSRYCKGIDFEENNVVICHHLEEV